MNNKSSLGNMVSRSKFNNLISLDIEVYLQIRDDVDAIFMHPL